MFRKRKNKDSLSKELVDYLGDHNLFKSHSARIGVKELRAKRVRVDIINKDEQLYDRVMRVYYSIVVTFQTTGAYKIFENSRGDALIRLIKTIPMQVPPVQRPRQPQQGAQG